MARTPSGAPYSYGKQKETHELIFSWSSWLAVLLVGAYVRRDGDGVAQHGGHTPNLVLFLPDGYAILMRPNKAETAVNGCHCPGDMAVRMRYVLASSRVSFAFIVVDRDMHPWFTVYFFDIGHPCYDQSTPVNSNFKFQTRQPYAR